MTHDSNAPATLGQIERLLQKELQMALQIALQPVHRKLKSVEEGVDQVLTVLVNVDKRLSSDIQHHDKRLKRLEKKAGLAPLAA